MEQKKGIFVFLGIAILACLCIGIVGVLLSGIVLGSSISNIANRSSPIDSKATEKPVEITISPAIVPPTIIPSVTTPLDTIPTSPPKPTEVMPLVVNTQEISKAIFTPTANIIAPATSIAVYTPTTSYRDDLIVNTVTIIDSNVVEVEKQLGVPTEIVGLGIGEVEETPQGGEARTYKVGKYTVWVNFDKQGIAKGIQVVEGLAEDNYSLSEWRIILSRVGVEFVALPDVEAPAAMRWDNAYGYFIMIATRGIGKEVWTIRVYKLPD